MRCHGIRLFEDEKMMNLLNLYRRYHSPKDLSKETGISYTHCCRIYKNPKELNLSGIVIAALKKALIEFKERIGDQNAANSEIKMDAFHNSHVETDFDKSNKQVLREALLEEVIAAVRKMSTDSLMSLYLDLDIKGESDEEDTLR